MTTRPLNRYLKLALGIALASCISSTLILIVGMSGPLGFMAPRQDGYWEHVGYVATLSSAVSSIFSLIVGAIAIIAVIVAERAETRSIEQLKVDISKLWMSLLSIRDRGALYTAPEHINHNLDLFSEERKAITEVLAGPTGFSLYVWQARQTCEDTRGITNSLAGVTNLLTLNSELGHNLYTHIFKRANTVANVLSKLTEKDIADMALVLNDLGRGLDIARELADRDLFGELAKGMDADEIASAPRPTREQIEQATAAAKDKLGEKAAAMVEQLGERALSGTGREVLIWHKLLRELKLTEH